MRAKRPDYYEAIYAVIRRVPRGRVASYGQIAMLAGLGRRARIVGRALRECREADKVPWHRVVNAQGRISTRQTCEGEPELLQAALLRREKVPLSPSGRVDFDQARWDPDVGVVRPRVVIRGGRVSGTRRKGS